MRTHFKSIVIESASHEVDAGDLVIFYNEKTALLNAEVDKFADILEKVASGYDDDVKNGCSDEEIGGFSKLAAEEGWSLMRSQDEPEELIESPFMKDMLTAVILDFLLYQGVISLPEGDGSSDEEIVGHDEESDDE